MKFTDKVATVTGADGEYWYGDVAFIQSAESRVDRVWLDRL